MLILGVQHDDLIYIYIYYGMISTINLANICHHTLYNFSLVMRNFTMYSQKVSAKQYY